ncbi:MAG: hypothetical protein A3C35_04935 [Omnitrophica bacterium RIFCSPHIGHO2_02_FULL_46_11]|nr:MAG: hypothetical protein A3C35_04935 [Omnitrophica bacterium RIFCSPHIGHO2_02_FULL_46_11]OGW87782.1 MAG: hypothetical protein A3A81_01625 [Omnitrophica bacterium RIFCSPLOWO2_01_FULL_45_10b]
MSKFLIKKVGRVSFAFFMFGVISSSLAFAELESQGTKSGKIDPKEIQEALTEAGFYHGAIDGVIGSKTKAAIRSFQTKQGLVVDGVCGPKTWEKLKAYLEEATEMDAAAESSTLALEETVETSSQLDTELSPEPEPENLKQKLVS